MHKWVFIHVSTVSGSCYKHIINDNTVKCSYNMIPNFCQVPAAPTHIRPAVDEPWLPSAFVTWLHQLQRVVLDFWLHLIFLTPQYHSCLQSPCSLPAYPCPCFLFSPMPSPAMLFNTSVRLHRSPWVHLLYQILTIKQQKIIKGVLNMKQTSFLSVHTFYTKRRIEHFLIQCLCHN